MGVLHKYSIKATVGLLFTSTVLFAQPGATPPSGVTDPAITSTDFISVKGERWQPSLRKDGVIDRVQHNNYVNEWANIREADVMWKKRVWREIDTRQKQNIPFRYPGDDETGGGMYIEILMDAIKRGNITAFADERFTIPLTLDQIMTKLTGKVDTAVSIDPITGEEKLIVTKREFNPDNITKFRIKEDCIFDKNAGRLVTRIIGIAPFLDRYNDDNSYRGTIPMFWLYYKDLRPTNAKFEVYNPENDVFRITWDDFFEKRLFSSYIIKSSFDNPLDNDIDVYKKGIDRLYESEQVREKIFNKEHDMWVY